MSELRAAILATIETDFPDIPVSIRLELAKEAEYRMDVFIYEHAHKEGYTGKED